MGFLLDAACTSTRGKTREKSEDNFLFFGTTLPLDHDQMQRPISTQCPLRKNTCLAVFDGMGGEKHGEYASFAAARTLRKRTEKLASPMDLDEELLLTICQEMNQAVLNAGGDFKTKQIGATVAGLMLSEDCVYVFNLGDSRAYRLRDNTLCQLSSDHLETLYMARSRKAPLSQYLGIEENECIIEPYFRKHEIKHGDYFLLCSDGLSDMLSADELTITMTENQQAAACAAALVESAKSKGGWDDITVITCRVG